MATYKRRIVYLSDQEWADIQKWADGEGLTASAYVRHAVGALRGHPLRDQIDVAIETSAGRMTQANRDAILRRINKGG